MENLLREVNESFDVSLFSFPLTTGAIHIDFRAQSALRRDVVNSPRTSLSFRNRV